MREIRIKGVGPVRLERSNRARRLVISVRPHNGVRVAVPHNFSYGEAAGFANEKADWIRRHLDGAAAAEREYACRYQTPIDEQAAREELKRRLERLAKKHGFKYNKVTFRHQRTRWGSCSAADNISLNVKLVRLPDDLIDFVLLHELLHTRIKNHSPKFWKELDKLAGDHAQANARLKEYWLGYL